MNDSSSEVETSFQQAVEAFNSSNLDLAIDLFRTTVLLNPDHAEASAYNYLGEAYFRQGEYQDSVDCFNKVLEIEPTHTQARENLEVAQWRLGRVEGDSEYNEDDPWGQVLRLPPEQLLKVLKSMEAKDRDKLSGEQLSALQDFYSNLGEEIRANKERNEKAKQVLRENGEGLIEFFDNAANDPIFSDEKRQEFRELSLMVAASFFTDWFPPGFGRKFFMFLSLIIGFVGIIIGIFGPTRWFLLSGFFVYLGCMFSPRLFGYSLVFMSAFRGDEEKNIDNSTQ